MTKRVRIAISRTMSVEPIFDPVLARRRLARAAATGLPADFLLAGAVADIADRLGAVQRRFAHIADVGTPTPALAGALARAYPDAQVLRVAPRSEPGTVAGDPERLPLANGSCDLIVSALALHGVNDLPGALVQIRRALKPDGLFLAAAVGGRSLHELRTALTEADLRVHGGASPRVYPFADVRDMGGLLQRAGLALPVADSDVVTVRYANMFALMADLRAMGATSALVARSRRPATRGFFAEAARVYAERFADPDGRVRATFEIVSASGWAPHESQGKPARPGSGRVSLASALGDRSAQMLRPDRGSG